MRTEGQIDEIEIGCKNKLAAAAAAAVATVNTTEG